MHVNYFTYKNEHFKCLKCGWQGIGEELAYGDFSEINSICDLDCPSCFEHIGFWQAPLLEEVEKWKKANPGLDKI